MYRIQLRSGLEYKGGLTIRNSRLDAWFQFDDEVEPMDREDVRKRTKPIITANTVTWEGPLCEYLKEREGYSSNGGNRFTGYNFTHLSKKPELRIRPFFLGKLGFKLESRDQAFTKIILPEDLIDFKALHDFVLTGEQKS